MKSVNLTFAALLLLLLGACKVEIEVPTSGSITTNSGNISCAAGDLCNVDVTDIYFDEIFVAEPAEGFVFVGWKNKDRGFCGGKTTPCRLNTAGFGGSDVLTAILNDPAEVFYLEPAFQSTGFKSLFIGHSFFKPFAQGIPSHATQAGIVNHSQSIVFSGGASGAPQALWDNANKRAEIQAILDGGDIEFFAMTYHPDYPDITGYKKWVEYALAQNPHTRFAVALPWEPYPSATSAATYESNWHAFHPTDIHDGIDYLRSIHPGLEIYCIPYGQSAVELRKHFDAGTLDDVDVLTSSSGDAIYRDSLGHPDDILIDLGRLVWLNAIYGVELTTYAHDPGYNADLKGIAQGIMDAHDPAYDAPYR